MSLSKSVEVNSSGQNSLSSDAQLDALFGVGGALGAAVAGFHPRQSQIDMAKVVGLAVREHRTLLAEAGTGTGKTFAYLVPAFLWGGKVILSTGTKNLQDQLFLRDIPVVRDALKLPVTVTLLKGRANYVCHYHLERISENGRLTRREDVGYLRTIRRFAKTSASGDKAELAGVPENDLIWSLVTSTRENCLGNECPAYQECFVVKARKAAQQADLVVVNHHLFFADLALKDSGVSDLLPTANTVIFDEAHQLPDIATIFFGETVSTAQIMELCRNVLAEGLTHARDAAKWGEVVAPVENAARELRLSMGVDISKMALDQIAPSSPFFAALVQLKKVLAFMGDILKSQSERAETIAACHTQMLLLLDGLNQWDAPCENRQAAVCWIETYTNTVQLHRTPLDIAPIFNKQREGGKRAWIFTSATLAVKQDFRYFASQLGLDGELAQSWPSPFDYEEQGLFYVPQGMPMPHSLQYTDSVINAALPVIEAAGGCTFLLCTTNRAVQHAAQRIRAHFEAYQWPYPLFVQGEVGRTELLKRFRAAGNAVLIGSHSFWEGVDVRGQALSLVIIDKLPFAPPDDPVLAARIAELEKQGLDGFTHYQLPQAVISLKQGVGRLIRDENDRGVLMICDPRLINRPYGRRIWQSLPPFKRTRELSDVLAFFTRDEEMSVN